MDQRHNRLCVWGLEQTQTLFIGIPRTVRRRREPEKTAKLRNAIRRPIDALTYPRLACDNHSMKQVVFVTGNKWKISDAKAALTAYGITVRPRSLELEEIQSHDPHRIAMHKARQAHDAIQQPLVVNDASWSFPALGGFPGGYIKDVVQWFTTEDFLSLLRFKKDKSLTITETVTYIDGDTTQTFSHKLQGTIILSPRGSGTSIETIAEFSGHTLAELHSQNLEIKPDGPSAWEAFGNWYSKQP